MKFVAMGSLGHDDVKELEGQCCIVLVGSPDEVRSTAALLFKEVEITLSLAEPMPEPPAPLDLGCICDEEGCPA